MFDGWWRFTSRELGEMARLLVVDYLLYSEQCLLEARTPELVFVNETEDSFQREWNKNGLLLLNLSIA